ncbi:hypothetical protein G6F53_005279 [Rhizopus delemar]|uniref:Uncharacterized protein n=1 Tax=Rhizopus delemar TaxID=936053 RepID=A0A9P7CPC5_9FUNG|nr:hypothetical protein G6F54_004088 [Rhizopus delemar]KAG1512316.1 hypothetical protein G6F53_005279 [Rhizopus delemar]KAG1570550.1 hypothetical protein G6F50_005395 [Rhizopus delemar]
MVHIAQICIAILVISAIVSAAPCGNREPSVAAHSDYSTHLSCENTNNDESFDDGNDSFVDTTNHVAVTEDAPCDDEVDGISSEETSSLSNQNFNIIGVSPGENIVDTVIIDNTLNNLIARDVTRKETSKTNNQNFNVIGVSPGKNVVDTVAISDTLNNLITRDVTRKENSKTNNQNFNIIGVSPGKNIRCHAKGN